MKMHSNWVPAAIWSDFTQLYSTSLHNTSLYNISPSTKRNNEDGRNSIEKRKKNLLKNLKVENLRKNFNFMLCLD